MTHTCYQYTHIDKLEKAMEKNAYMQHHDTTSYANGTQIKVLTIYKETRLLLT